MYRHTRSIYRSFSIHRTCLQVASAAPLRLYADKRGGNPALVQCRTPSFDQFCNLLRQDAVNGCSVRMPRSDTRLLLAIGVDLFLNLAASWARRAPDWLQRAGLRGKCTPHTLCKDTRRTWPQTGERARTDSRPKRIYWMTCPTHAFRLMEPQCRIIRKKGRCGVRPSRIFTSAG